MIIYTLKTPLKFPNSIHINIYFSHSKKNIERLIFANQKENMTWIHSYIDGRIFLGWFANKELVEIGFKKLIK